VSDKEIIGELADAAEALSDLPEQETQPTAAMWGGRAGKADPVSITDASDSARVADVSNPTPAAPPTAPPGTPSIAVVAFTNMTGEVDQEYLSDSISEDIATQLSHSDALFVLGCKWSFRYKGQASDVKQIGRELGVRYLLQGSVRREAPQVQIGVQLVDAETGNNVWAQCFQRSVTDLSEMQDEIADAVALAIDPEISPEERQRISCRPIVSFGVVQDHDAAGSAG
jgi:TolB-like protein